MIAIPGRHPMNISSSHKRTGLHAYGDKFLCIKDLDWWKGHEYLTGPRQIAFELDDGIEEVEKGFFDLIPTIGELEIASSVKNLGLTENTLKLFRDNSVLIRGKFDTYAERFARENNISFIHSDFVIGRAGDYSEPWGTDVITLRFQPGSKPEIRQSNFCQGSSAGSSGGGDIDFYLPKDFYRYKTQEDIAGMCWGTCYESIMKCDELRVFLEKAVKKHGYYFKHR